MRERRYLPIPPVYFESKSMPDKELLMALVKRWR